MAIEDWFSILSIFICLLVVVRGEAAYEPVGFFGHLCPTLWTDWG
jgi:hypothetical protein